MLIDLLGSWSNEILWVIQNIFWIYSEKKCTLKCEAMKPLDETPKFFAMTLSSHRDIGHVVPVCLVQIKRALVITELGEAHKR